jgi:hypothetical protein
VVGQGARSCERKECVVGSGPRKADGASPLAAAKRGLREADKGPQSCSCRICLGGARESERGSTLDFNLSGEEPIAQSERGKRKGDVKGAESCWVRGICSV